MEKTPPALFLLQKIQLKEKIIQWYLIKDIPASNHLMTTLINFHNDPLSMVRRYFENDEWLYPIHIY